MPPLRCLEMQKSRPTNSAGRNCMFLSLSQILTTGDAEVRLQDALKQSPVIKAWRPLIPTDTYLLGQETKVILAEVDKKDQLLFSLALDVNRKFLQLVGGAEQDWNCDRYDDWEPVLL